MKVVYLKNFRKGLATNSSSTHSIIYKKEEDVFNDLNIFDLDYYDRFDSTIAATREAKIKYILAAIYWNEDLTKIMSLKYPEMKQYYPLIKKQEEGLENRESVYDEVNHFGMTCRGALNTDNIPFSVDYLSEVIDNPELIIIGGSDEGDFVYDTIEGHNEKAMPDDLSADYERNSFNRDNIVRNGNYWYAYGSKYVINDDTDNKYKYGKIRFTERDEQPNPEYPELIDLRITNKCNHDCPFCFMDSTIDEPNADVGFIKTIVHGLNNQRIEFSIGGGNILLHKNLEEILSYIHDEGHIVNITINAKDIDTVMNDDKYLNIIKNYVNGIGISAFSVRDAQKINKFDSFINKLYSHKNKYVTVHLIPELLGIELTRKICETVNVPKLFLGYKTNGRGASQTVQIFTPKNLDELFNDMYCISIDTTFADRYNAWITTHYATQFTLNGGEGEYSMYIDAVKKKGYKSSYELDKPYEMDYTKRYDDNSIKTYGIKEAFQEIRKDNGFEPYKAKHYYD